MTVFFHSSIFWVASLTLAMTRCMVGSSLLTRMVKQSRLFVYSLLSGKRTGLPPAGSQ
ncbi:MAG: hypothetical protein LBP63_00330 [Prevotellaceae bacterium]|nr:hypothetical protein [Prevotellaceae bacterium]